MTRGRWVAIAVGLALLLPAGCKWRERSRWAADRAALRAELLDSIAARARRPKPMAEVVPDGENAAPLWRQAADAVDLASLTKEYYEIIAPGKEWDGESISIAAALAANATSLDLAEQAGQRPRCGFQDAGILLAPGTWKLSGLLLARGRLAAASGDFAGAVADAVLLRRMSRDFDGILAPSQGMSARHASFQAERHALDLLRSVAVHPELDGEGARAALAACGSPWRFQLCGEGSWRNWRATMEPHFVELLDPDSRRAMAAVGASPRDLERWARDLLRGEEDARAPRKPPSAADVRRALETLDAVEAADRAGDHEALRPGGTIYRAEIGEEGMEWPPCLLTGGQIGLPWLRMRGEAMAEAVRGVLALRLLEAREGRPAKGWADLVPGILDAPPRDPYTGGPLDLEITPEGGVVSARVWAGIFEWPMVNGSTSFVIDPVRVEWKRKGKAR